MLSHENIGVSYSCDEEMLWVPWEIADGVYVKIHNVDPVHGLIVAKMKMPGGMELGRHRHTGFVQLYTVQGEWKYEEHSWISRAGDVVYETADSVHTFLSLPGEDVIIFVILNGSLEFLDEKDDVLFAENWRTYLERQAKYYESEGLPIPDVASFIEVR